MRFRGLGIGAVASVVLALSAGAVSAEPTGQVVNAADTAGAVSTGADGASSAVATAATPTSAGAFVSLNPARVLDTRSRIGASGPVGAKRTVRLQVTGRGGVPSSGVAAVVLNVTVTSAKGSGYVTVFPDGTTRPTASNVNFSTGRTVANLVTVRVGNNGKVALYNGSSKSVQLIADVAGYYRSGTPSAAGTFVSVNPKRVLDTRSGNGASGPVASNRSVQVQVGGRGGIPSSGVSAVVLNVTATSTKASGYLTVFPDGTSRPGTSNANFTKGSTVANLVTVRLGSNGKVALYNHSSQSIQLVADVAGYYRSGTPKVAGAFVSLNPARVLDTRSNNGASGPVFGRQRVFLTALGRGGVRTVGVSSVMMNVTVTSSEGSGYVTVYPSGQARPTASNLNFSGGRTVANLATVKVGSDGAVRLYNGSATDVQLVGDVSGYFLSTTLITATSISGGFAHTCARTAGGQAICWGQNDNGALGNGTTQDSARPVQVSGLTSGVKAVATGTRHSCAITGAGGVKCWGQNDEGQLGNGATGDRTSPVDVSGLSSGVAAIALGEKHSCALTTAGAVKCWGLNSSGQLGNGSTTSSLTPVNVSGLSSGQKSLAAGRSHTCVVTDTDGAKCWGRGLSGQVGAPAAQSFTTPVAVSGLSSGVRSVVAGGAYSCAVTTSGGVECWGLNQGPVSGNGSTWPTHQPAPVSGLSSGVKTIAAGDAHTCALTTAGAVKCWGNNFDGELGNGTRTDSRTPVGVSGLSSGVSAIGLGTVHSCAVTASGVAKCWGSNTGNQLGSYVLTRSLRPLDVADF